MESASILDHFEDWGFLQDLKNRGYRHLSCEEMRKASWATCRAEAEIAEREQRPITQAEWNMGQRKEWLEPEVREAISVMQRKGYTTYYSGFEGSDGLHIVDFVTKNPVPEEIRRTVWKITDTEGVLTWFDGNGLITKEFDPNMCQEFNKGEPIYIHAIRFIETSGNPEKIRQHWNRIAVTLPPLEGEVHLPVTTEWADNFRKTHQLAQK